MQNKKLMMIIGLVVIVLLIGGGVMAYMKSKSSTSNTAQTQQKKTVTAPVNVIAVDQRPYLQIVPVDQHNLSLRVITLKKPATSDDYELEYQAGSLLQGAFGTISTASLPADKTILLGSCSAGGACTYHTDIQGGTLLSKFSGSEDYAVKSDWRYFDNQAKGTQIASRDAKFQLDSASLKTNRFIVVFNNAGYPDGLTGTPMSDPYTVTSASPLSGSATLTLRANDEGATAIMGWNGSSWKEFPAKADGKSLTATVDLMETYIAVKK